MVLGASLGFEAYVPALTYGVRTVGLELLCGLAGLAEEVARIRVKARVRFRANPNPNPNPNSRTDALTPVSLPG